MGPSQPRDGAAAADHDELLQPYVVWVRPDDNTRSEAHHLPIILVHAANGAFGRHVAFLFVFPTPVPHLQDRFAVLFKRVDAVLSHHHNLTVVHRHETRGAKQFSMADSSLPHRLVVILEPEMSPHELKPFGTLWNDVSDLKRIDLLKNEHARKNRAGPDRLDAFQLLDRFDQASVRKLHGSDGGNKTLDVPSLALYAGVMGRCGHEAAVPPGFVHAQLAVLIRAEQSERGQKNVQKRPMIG